LEDKKYALMIIAIVAIVAFSAFVMTLQWPGSNNGGLATNTGGKAIRTDNTGGKAIQANIKQPCTMVWLDSGGNTLTSKPYNPASDSCVANGNERVYLGNYKLADSCFTAAECASYKGSGKCVLGLTEICS
jgi:hypothetical protein